jgi:hypothetical protein
MAETLQGLGKQAPLNAGPSRRPRRSCADKQVVWAVRFEPVSARNSLLTGHFTGKFAISGLRETIAEALNRCAAVTFQAFPYAG